MGAIASTASLVKQLSPDESPEAAQWRQVIGGLAGRIDRVPVGVLYHFGLLLVAATMIVLPILYVGVIVLAGVGVYWYAVHATVMFEAMGRSGGRGGGRLGLLLLVAYLGPLVAGAILVFFMVKPLFARRQVTSHPLSLERGEQPLLFAYVDRLCEVVGSPKPRRIDVDTNVNASASFREGWWGFIRKDLVLTIGLPLVTGMDLRMLTGVLAHEFGHFAQGTGMRLTYLIRTINGWFARVVYERDAWDQWLIDTSASAEHWAISLVIGLSRLFVWMTRRILWVLMVVGHVVSSFALRQMEFDADRYEARVAGSDTFPKTSERLELLQVASHAALNELDSAWREKRLCDDLPSLIRAREVDIPTDLRRVLHKHQAEGKTGWFDTHPATADRIRSAQREAAPGIFAVDAPATALFRNYDDLARRATVAFYHEELGGQVRPEHLVGTETLVADSGKKQQSYKALRRYCQDLVHPIRPVWPGGEVPKDGARRADMLLELRDKLMGSAERAGTAVEQYEKADDRMVAVARARALRSAGEGVNLKEFDFKRGDEGELIAVVGAAAQSKRAASVVLDPLLADAMLRMEIALSLESAPAATSPAADAAENYDVVAAPPPGSDDRLRRALAVLQSAAPIVESLRQNFYLLGSVASRLRSEKNSESLIQEVLSRSKYVGQDLFHLQNAVRQTAYPYAHNDRSATLLGYVCPAVPQAQEVGNVYGAAERALDSVYGLYMRIMSDLAARAEAVEADLGLPPLPEPAEKKEEEPGANAS